ncbi:MAG TPA: hypothetical protein VFB23_12435, partial [Candidatus Acidoferrales bacterium]|nr:hypothetical protein [Candidatus Acidoferrales bacterium]
KENQSPWQIIERLAPRSPLELCLLPPVFLDYYLNDSGGYDVPRLPYDGADLGQTGQTHGRRTPRGAAGSIVLIKPAGTQSLLAQVAG